MMYDIDGKEFNVGDEVLVCTRGEYLNRAIITKETDSTIHHKFVKDGTKGYTLKCWQARSDGTYQQIHIYKL